MMKKNINDKYRILLDSERLPFEVDKEKTDQAVSNLINTLSQVCAELRELDSNDFDGLSRMIRDYDSQADLYHFVLTLDALESLQADLKKEDVEVPAADDLKYLEDEGFKQKSGYRWEKTIEDTDGKEVVEVVYLMGDNEALHRKITYEYLDGLNIKNVEAEGFKQDRSDSDLWTKTIEDIDGKKVVEEVYFLGDQAFHSKKTYENMPIDENLKIVAQNTWEREYVHDDYDEWW